jgi:hypothetical protein
LRVARVLNSEFVDFVLSQDAEIGTGHELRAADQAPGFESLLDRNAFMKGNFHSLQHYVFDKQALHALAIV